MNTFFISKTEFMLIQITKVTFSNVKTPRSNK